MENKKKEEWKRKVKKERKKSMYNLKKKRGKERQNENNKIFNLILKYTFNFT